VGPGDGLMVFWHSCACERPCCNRPQAYDTDKADDRRSPDRPSRNVDEVTGEGPSQADEEDEFELKQGFMAKGHSRSRESQGDGDAKSSSSSASAVSAVPMSPNRRETITVIFQELNPGSATLPMAKLRIYAEFCGFDGGDSEWALEYQALCKKYGWNADAGVTVAQFMEIVNDKSSTGFCTDIELTGLLQQMGIAYPELKDPKRPSLVLQLFDKLDVKQKGRLTKSGMHQYAKLCGFEGGQQEWSKEFEALCRRYGWDTKRGIDTNGFAKFVNDPEGAAYCKNAELEALVEEAGAPKSKVCGCLCGRGGRTAP